VGKLATEEWTLQGQRVLRGHGNLDYPSSRIGPREVLVLPEQGVVVSVESPDPEESQATAPAPQSSPVSCSAS